MRRIIAPHLDEGIATTSDHLQWFCFTLVRIEAPDFVRVHFVGVQTDLFFQVPEFHDAVSGCRCYLQACVEPVYFDYSRAMSLQRGHTLFKAHVPDFNHLISATRHEQLIHGGELQVPHSLLMTVERTDGRQSMRIPQFN